MAIQNRMIARHFRRKKMLTSLQPVGFEAFGARTGSRTAGTHDTRWMLSWSGSFRHYIRWKHMLSDVSWRNDLDLDWFSQMTCTNRSLWFAWFRVVLPACQSLNFRLSNKTCQFKKQAEMSIPTSLKGLFMLITHIEMRISSKHLGMLISLRLLKLCDYIVLP